MRHDNAYPRFGAGPATVLALLFLLAAAAVPARAEDMYSQMLQRYEEVNAELERAIDEIENGVEPAPAPKRVLSLNRNASVTIGGEVRTAYTFAKSSGEAPGFDPGVASADREFRMKTGDFSIATARLSVDARMGDRWRAYVDLNMQGSNGLHSVKDTINPNDPAAPPGSPHSTDYERRNAAAYPFLNQAYVELMKGDHSGFGGIVGLVKLPFGLWRRPNLFAKSFLDSPDLTGSYLMQSEGWEGGARLPHASRFLDPAVAAMLYYEMRDIVRFDAVVFQERREKDVAGRDGNVRSDEAAPLSWQLGASLQPLDGWELTAHFRNRHSRSRGIGYWANSSMRWDFRANLAAGGGNDPVWDNGKGQWSDAGTGEGFGSVSNEQALVVGAAAEIPGTKLAASVEYAHGWNQGFNKHINSDSVNVGLSYELTPRLTLYAQGEWLHVKDRSWMAPVGGGWKRDTRDSHLYRAMLGAEYELADYLTLEAGWQYEYWKTRAAELGEESLITANMLYFGTRLVF